MAGAGVLVLVGVEGGLGGDGGQGTWEGEEDAVDGAEGAELGFVSCALAEVVEITV